MLKDIQKISTIVLPTIIIASPVSSLNCDRASSQINSVNNEPVNIPYDDEFKSLVPDSYVCPYSCNSCRFKIKKFDSYYQISGGSCTLLGCYPNLYKKDEIIIDHKLCFENWMFSESLSYNDLSLSLERCIHGYRNITYVKKQQTLDENFSLEDSKTPEHTYLALGKGITLCQKLYKLLKEKGRFSDDKIKNFSVYLENRYFWNPFRDCFPSLGEETNDLSQLCMNSFDKYQVKSQKDIFNYLSNNLDQTNGIITSEMIEQFEQEYQEYLTDKRANQRKKMSEFWHDFLDFLKF